MDMKGWILYHNDFLLDSYENIRFLEEAQVLQITLEIVHPHDFSWTIGGDFSLLYKGESMPLPDFILPRLGAITDTVTWNLLQYVQLYGVRLINSISLIRLA